MLRLTLRKRKGGLFRKTEENLCKVTKGIDFWSRAKKIPKGSRTSLRILEGFAKVFEKCWLTQIKGIRVEFVLKEIIFVVTSIHEIWNCQITFISRSYNIQFIIYILCFTVAVIFAATSSSMFSRQNPLKAENSAAWEDGY